MANDISNPFNSPDIKSPLDDNWAAKRNVSAALRRLIENLVTCTTDTDTLNNMAVQLNEQADALEQAPRLHGRMAFEEAEDISSHAHLGYELNPLDGKSNPIAAPIIVWVDADRVYGKVTMGWQYEGPPKAVHGGFVAALFDQFLGVGQKITEQPGFTGTLTIKYLQPTPIDTELRLEGWVDRVDGRKNYMVGEMWAGDVKTASCEGVFISITPQMYRRMQNL